MSGAFQHPWLGAWLGDAETAAIFSADRDLERMREIEISWIEAQNDIGTVDTELALRAVQHIKDCTISMSDLSVGVTQDGLPVPQLVRSLRQDAAEDIRQIIHTGLTSQDVLDTAMCLALRDVSALFQTRITALIGALTQLEKAHSANTLMGHTRMQAALPISAGTRIASWQRPLEKYQIQLSDAAARLEVIQFGGPVGERGAYQANGTIAAFAKRLALRDPGHAWHTDRSDLVAYTAVLSHISGSLGKLGQDITLMAQTGADAIKLRGGGSSSAMPHKQNPILGELLVSLGHHCATLQCSMTRALIHEQERSGAAWTLEMLTLNDLVQTCGRSMTAALDALEQIEQIGQ